MSPHSLEFRSVGSDALVPWVSSDDLSACVMSHLARLRTPVNSYFTVSAVAKLYGDPYQHTYRIPHNGTFSDGRRWGAGFLCDKTFYLDSAVQFKENTFDLNAVRVLFRF